MIIMSVDLGLARTGIALCDALQTLAFPKTVIHEHNTGRLVDKIAQLAKEYDAKRIVVGLPRNMDGSEGERAQTCRQIADLIGAQSGVEVVLRDERNTTVSAYTALNAGDVRGKKRKNVVDAVAATIILQDYLDFLKHTKE